MTSLLGAVRQRLQRLLSPLAPPSPAAAAAAPFPGSAAYWDQRYAAGGDSGAGSYGKFAAFKARVLNDLFAERGVQSVIEFGCGDGNQLALLQVPDYLGIDVSPQAIARCRERFAGVPGRRFLLAADWAAQWPDEQVQQSQQADCSLSLDVIYHLVEDTAFDAHMRQLFGAARALVVVYSSNHDDDAARRDGVHVRHRVFMRWVDAHAPQWRLWRKVPNEHPYTGDYRQGSFADFHVFTRTGASGAGRANG